MRTAAGLSFQYSSTQTGLVYKELSRNLIGGMMEIRVCLANTLSAMVAHRYGLTRSDDCFSTSQCFLTPVSRCEVVDMTAFQRSAHSSKFGLFVTSSDSLLKFQWRSTSSLIAANGSVPGTPGISHYATTDELRLSV
jgi:hypothetical protein